MLIFFIHNIISYFKIYFIIEIQRKKNKKEMPNIALLILLISLAQYAAIYAESDNLKQQAYGIGVNFMKLREKLSAKRFIGLEGMWPIKDLINFTIILNTFRAHYSEILRRRAIIH
jgi:hypothetical protein